jgi:hypothetical protein
MGWLGRPGASDMREPDCERAWLGGNWDGACCMPLTELVRFMAEAGMGIADMLLFMGAKDCARRQTVLWEGATGGEIAQQKADLLRGVGGPKTCPTPGPWLCRLFCRDSNAGKVDVVPNAKVLGVRRAVGLRRLCVDAPAVFVVVLRAPSALAPWQRATLPSR